jgi:uncharacterized protein YceH (UPF0502 family)
VERPSGGERAALTAPQRRILGCLIEKERTTPQNYPLTLNALRLACNQTTNRDPITHYDDATLEDALVSLREQGLTRIVYSTSNRAAKYRHVLGDAWRLDDEELAVLAVLVLRGPQTLGEIKARTERLADFADLAAVQARLEGLAVRGDGAFVLRHERRPGQKDARWVHLLGDPGETGDDDGWAISADGDHEFDEGTGPAPASRPAARPGGVAELTGEVTRLRAEVDALRSELGALRAEFETFRSEFR